MKLSLGYSACDKNSGLAIQR